MVAVQNLLGTLQVHVVLGVLTPGQVHQRLQVGELYVEVWRVLVYLVQLLHLFVEVFLDVLGPVFFAGFFQQVFLFGCTLVAHLGLQVFYLLLQEVVALLFVNVVTRLVADVELQRLQVDFAVNDAQHVEQSLLQRV